jgi:hypothetical protein
VALYVETPLSPFVKAVLLFVAVNALIGAVSLIGFPSRTESLFFWRITPPITASLFGALYLGGAGAVTHAVIRGRWETARYLVPVLVCAGALLTMTTFLHLDRFIQGMRLYYWLGIYIGAPLLAIAIYVYYERRGARWDVVGQPITGLTRAIATVTGIVLVAFGALSRLWPHVLIAVWPWEISPLMVRVFGSWFTAFAPGLLWFTRERDWDRVYPVASLMIASGVLDLAMTALHRDDLRPDPLRIAVYCAHLAGFALLGAAMYWSQRRAAATARQPGASPDAP